MLHKCQTLTDLSQAPKKTPMVTTLAFTASKPRKSKRKLVLQKDDDEDEETILSFKKLSPTFD